MTAGNLLVYALAPNEGRNNWCHFELQDFDFETFRDFFRLRDQKTSGAMAPVAPPSSAPLIFTQPHIPHVSSYFQSKQWKHKTIKNPP